MTAFLLQTLMLMVPAFFIGAALACGLRRLMQPAQAVLVAPVRAQPSHVDPLPQYATRDASLAAPNATPASQSAPVPSGAQIAAPPKPATPMQPATPAGAAAGRFDDTLKARSAEASRPTATAVPQPPAAMIETKVVEPHVRAVPPPPAGPTAAPAAGAATAARAAQPPAATTAPVIATAERIAAAAAAMAAAAAAVAAHATSVAAKNTTAPDPQSAKQAASPSVPNNTPATNPAAAAAAAAAAGAAMSPREPARLGGTASAPPPASSGVVVPPVRDAVMPAKMPAGADDLTKISNIDAALVTQLGKLGVSRYNQIAAWRKADVDTISQGLGFKGRIEQENWIEQAQILAGGGETFYSARRAKVVEPGPAARAPLPAAVAQPPVSVASPVGQPSAIAAAAVVPATLPKVEERAAFAQSPGASRAQPAIAVPPERAVVIPAAAVPAVAAAVASVVGAAAPPPTASAIPAAAAMRPPMAPVRDSLQRIGTVNGEIEKLLTGQGVTRYSQIAGWSSSEIERFDRLLGSQGRIARENWVEQAQILAKGGDTAHSREYDRRNVDTTRDQAPARPMSITEAIKANAGAVAAAGSAVSSRADIGGLRSVRSDAYKTANDAATAAAAAAAAGIGSAKVVRSAEIDDLKRIRGIGVLIEKRLNSVGIVSYGQIADWTTVDIDRVSASLDFKGRIERENWVEQARILSAGGQTEFSRRVDRGEVETSKPKS